MKFHLIEITILFILSSCTGRNQDNYTDSSGRKEKGAGIVKVRPAVSALDTTWLIFRDSSYRLNIHIFNPAARSENEINSVVTFNQVRAGKTKQIFQDSLFCTDYYIVRQDFNNDHVKDVLIYNYPGEARANPTYHLYLVDKVHHQLKYVQGFEKLFNPGMDSVYNVISSLRFSGNNYYSFYKINSRNRLINLGHGYAERPDDSTQYERAVRAIIIDRRKKEVPGATK
jgi:hypothetical protein